MTPRVRHRSRCRRDLGYFIGHRIVEAYYNRAADKPQAIREIIAARNVRELLAQSGYDP
jgi:hypothetical protein